MTPEEGVAFLEMYPRVAPILDIDEKSGNVQVLYWTAPTNPEHDTQEEEEEEEG